MNSPNPIPPMPVTPPPGSAVTTTAPTLGSILGTVAGLWATQKMGLNPADGGVGSTVAVSIAGTVTGLFHMLGVKIAKAAAAAAS